MKVICILYELNFFFKKKNKIIKRGDVTYSIFKNICKWMKKGSDEKLNEAAGLFK